MLRHCDKLRKVDEEDRGLGPNLFLTSFATSFFRGIALYNEQDLYILKMPSFPKCPLPPGEVFADIWVNWWTMWNICTMCDKWVMCSTRYILHRV